MAISLLLAMSCTRLPPASSGLDAVLGNVFRDMDADKDLLLDLSASELAAWLAANPRGIEDGFRIAPLDQATLDALPTPRTRDASRWVGAAVATTTDQALFDLARVLLLSDQRRVYPDDYERWNDDFRVDPACFLSQACDEVLVDVVSVTKLPLVPELTATSTVQYRWVDTELGRGLVARSWLQDPARANADLLRLEDQVFLSALLPAATGLVRVQALWADAEVVSLELSEDRALTLLVERLREQDDALYEWTERTGGETNEYYYFY